MAVTIKLLLALLLVGLPNITLFIQHQKLIAEREKNTTLSHDIVNKTATIQQLQEAQASNKKRLVQLQTESHRITTTLAEREALIERLYHDNPQIQSWADTPLPDAVVRLRQRNASTGAGDYHPELPKPESLLPASGQSENQR